jgi:S-DNA-T family DNA segregation ATPase FtsK/SpoIIIE
VGLNVMLVSLLSEATPEERAPADDRPQGRRARAVRRHPAHAPARRHRHEEGGLALRWAVDEMERRYQLFADAGTRNITTYNGWVDKVLRGELAPAEALCPRAREGARRRARRARSSSPRRRTAADAPSCPRSCRTS